MAVVANSRQQTLPPRGACGGLPGRLQYAVQLLTTTQRSQATNRSEADATLIRQAQHGVMCMILWARGRYYFNLVHPPVRLVYTIFT